MVVCQWPLWRMIRSSRRLLEPGTSTSPVLYGCVISAHAGHGGLSNETKRRSGCVAVYHAVLLRGCPGPNRNGCTRAAVIWRRAAASSQQTDPPADANTNYLSGKTGYRVQFETAKDIPTFERQLGAGAYDMAYMNPYHYTVSHDSPGYIAFAKERDRQLQRIRS